MADTITLARSILEAGDRGIRETEAEVERLAQRLALVRSEYESGGASLNRYLARSVTLHDRLDRLSAGLGTAEAAVAQHGSPRAAAEALGREVAGATQSRREPLEAAPPRPPRPEAAPVLNGSDARSLEDPRTTRRPPGNEPGANAPRTAEAQDDPRPILHTGSVALATALRDAGHRVRDAVGALVGLATIASSRAAGTLRPSASRRPRAVPADDTRPSRGDADRAEALPLAGSDQRGRVPVRNEAATASPDSAPDGGGDSASHSQANRRASGAASAAETAAGVGRRNSPTAAEDAAPRPPARPSETTATDGPGRQGERFARVLQPRLLAASSGPADAELRAQVRTALEKAGVGANDLERLAEATWRTLRDSLHRPRPADVPRPPERPGDDPRWRVRAEGRRPRVLDPDDYFRRLLVAGFDPRGAGDPAQREQVNLQRQTVVKLEQVRQAIARGLAAPGAAIARFAPKGAR
jgi:hypothetical protein